MTTKYLTGAYPSGYTVANNITVLDIESTASVGGTGIFDLNGTNSLQITNDGTVDATSYSGIRLFSDAGGNIINGNANYSALIEGSKSGVYGRNMTVMNFGTIEGFGAAFGNAGVDLFKGGYVANGSTVDTTALIKGAYAGILGSAGSMKIVNFATIEATGSTGVSLGSSNATYTYVVTNGSATDETALIEGPRFGVFVYSGSGTVINFGTISGGVAMTGGGVITNGSAADTTALIEGMPGIFWRPGPADITNYGTVLATGSNGVGIQVIGGGTITNGSAADTTALISGGGGGVYLTSLAATVVNFGTINGGSSGGVTLTAQGATVTNGSSADTKALITGGGSSLAGGTADIIVNFGTITGGASGGVTLSGKGDVLTNGSSTDTTASITGAGPVVASGRADTIVNYGTMSGVSLTLASDVLRVEAGCVFQNPLVQDAGTLSLVNGVGTIGNLTGGEAIVSGSMPATTFSGFGTLDIGKAARFTLMGSGEIAAGKVLNDQGVLTVSHALFVTGAVTGTGVIALQAGAIAEFVADAVPSSLTVSFAAGGSVLAMTDPSAFGATIGGFNRYGKIDLLGIAATSAVLEAGDKLVITNGAQAVATLQLTGSFTGDTFATRSDGSVGTYVTVSRGAVAAPRPSPSLPAPHALIAAAASLGALVGAGHAVSMAFSSYGGRLLVAPRSHIA